MCNKWDQVPEKEAKEVQEHVIKKLKKCWPGLDPKSQIIYMSTQRQYGSAPRNYYGRLFMPDECHEVDGFEKHRSPAGISLEVSILAIILNLPISETSIINY